MVYECDLTTTSRCFNWRNNTPQNDQVFSKERVVLVSSCCIQVAQILPLELCVKCEGKKTINEHEFRQKDMDPWDPTNETNARLHRRQEPSAD